MVGTEGIAPSASWMSGRRSAAELRPRKWCSRLGSHQRPPPSDDGALLTELRGNGKWSARSDLHAQGCLILNQVGLLFPVNHAPQNWRSWRDSHPLVIRLERATARRLCAQERMVGTAGVAPATCSM